MDTSHILIIDDDAGLLKALPDIVLREMEEVIVDTCNSPHKALERVASTDFDVIVSDVKMPGMDGLELLSKIRALRPDTPILLMTAHDERELVLMALRGGAFDFIQKPIDRSYFLAALERAIHVSGLRRQVSEQKQALERHAGELEQAVEQAVADAKAAQRRLAFLAEASTLLASSLDLEATLARVARLAVLYLADYCLVDIVEEDSTLRCVAVAHVNRTQETLVRQMRDSYLENAPQSYPAMAVVETGQSILHSKVTPAMLADMARDNRQLDLLQRLNPLAFMMVPLQIHDRILGVVTFGVVKAGRGYSGDDLALAEDLTRRAALAVENARLYQEAQQALQVRDTFLSIASHELKTPMTSILGIVQLLQRKVDSDPNVDPREKRRLKSLAEQTRRLNSLSDALLDLTRLESGQLVLNRTPLDARALARQVVEQMGLAVEDHIIECYTGAEPLVVYGDELRLEQVLQNLLHNAIKYSPQGGKVEVRVDQEGARVNISVTDHGIGIPAAALPRLFSRFYRADSPGSRQIRGLGLGLYVVKEIITLHGGNVAATSTEGEGSVFTISLPLQDQEDREAMEKAGVFSLPE